METQLRQDFYTWLNRRYRMSTIRKIINCAEIFDSWCEIQSINPQKATYNELLDYAKHCTAIGNEKRTINQKLTYLRHFFNYLIEVGQLEYNPATELRVRNQMKKAIYDTVNFEELEQVYVAYPAKGLTGKRNKAVLGLMIYQGVHTGELQAMELKDLKIEEGKIYIPSVGRTNDRTLKLEPQQIIQLQNYVLQIRPVLMAMYELNTDKLFFSAGSDRQISNSFTKVMRIIRSINPKIKDQRQIRASAIAHWHKLYNIRQVQYMTGHRHISSTELYKTGKLESLQEQLEKIHPIQ